MLSRLGQARSSPAPSDDARPPITGRSGRDLASRIESFHFSTGAFSPDEQFAAWRSEHVSVMDFRRGDERAFTGQYRLWDLGDMALQIIETDRMQFASLSGQADHGPLDHWLVCLPLTGQWSMEFSDGPRLEARPGLPLLYSLSDRFHGECTRSRTLALYIRRDIFAGLAHLLDRAAPTILVGGTGRIFADYLRSLVRCAKRLGGNDLDDLAVVTCSLLLAAIAHPSGNGGSIGPRPHQALLSRAKRSIRDNISSPDFGVNRLARSLGVSRSRLYRAFEGTDGIAHHIQRIRLEIAHDALADPLDQRRIVEIARSVGIRDAAQFSRAFRRVFGYSPSTIRPGETTMAGTEPEGGDASCLGQLLQRMQR